MQSRSVVKNVGVSPKKARIPGNIIKGMKVDEALNVLKFMPKGAALHLYKAVKSAAANAVQKEMKLESLYVSDVRIDKGQFRIKHYHPRARGGGYYVWNRGRAHITVILSDGSVEAPKKKEKVAKSEEAEVAKEKKVEHKKKVVTKKKATKATKSEENA